jgi:hypothetical protein
MVQDHDTIKLAVKRSNVVAGRGLAFQVLFECKSTSDGDDELVA